jgi:hypothetical protein
MYLAVSAMERLSRMRLNNRMRNTMHATTVQGGHGRNGRRTTTLYAGLSRGGRSGCQMSTPPFTWNNPTLDQQAATALAQGVARLEVGR